MVKSLSAVLRGLILVWGLGAAAAAAQACGVARLSTHPSIPPWSWEQDGRLIGVGVELAESLMADLGVKVDVSYAGAWGRVLGLAQKGQLDLVPNVFQTRARQAWLHYQSQPFYYDEAVVFVRRDSGLAPATLRELELLSGGTTRGDSWGEDVDAFVHRRGLHLASSTLSLFRQLELGRLDYAIFARFGGRAILNSSGLANRLVELPASLSREGMFIGLARQGNCAGLADGLDQALARWLSRNRVEDLIEKYEKLWKASHPG